VRRCAPLLAMVLWLAAIAGCGGLRQPAPPVAVGGVAMPEEGLWHARIVNDAGERFSGLLVTRREGAVVHYGVLDGTGIKLLQATVAGDGTQRVEAAVAAVQETPLPGYLGRAVARIFVGGPGSGHCVRRGMARLCEWLPEESLARRESRFGPFRLWAVEYILGGSRAVPTVERIQYAAFGQPRLQLQRVP
jgi:hypothetical protein